MVLKSFPRMVTLVTELKSKTLDVLIHQCILTNIVALKGPMHNYVINVGLITVWSPGLCCYL